MRRRGERQPPAPRARPGLSSPAWPWVASRGKSRPAGNKRALRGTLAGTPGLGQCQRPFPGTEVASAAGSPNRWLVVWGFLFVGITSTRFAGLTAFVKCVKNRVLFCHCCSTTILQVRCYTGKIHPVAHTSCFLWGMSRASPVAVVLVETVSFQCGFVM